MKDQLAGGEFGMKMHMSDAEGRVLHGLLEDASGDIVVRLDSAGFVIHASRNAGELGIDIRSMLLMPHISDFAERDYGEEVARHVTAVLTGEAQAGWIEFPVIVDDSETGTAASASASTPDCEIPEDIAHVIPLRTRRWFALNLRMVEPVDGQSHGAVGLIRSVQHKRQLEGELNARALTDPLTGLQNRHSFCASLRRHVTSGAHACMAIFAIDRMRAILMQYGHRTADEVQWGFAKFLEAMIRTDQELAQLDAERFAVLLPGLSVKDAKAWADDVLETFSGLTDIPSGNRPELTASAGLAPVEMTMDWTMRQAELGLVMARAGGGKRVGLCGDPSRFTSVAPFIRSNAHI